jgi:hypothetical protein
MASISSWFHNASRGDRVVVLLEAVVGVAATVVVVVVVVVEVVEVDPDVETASSGSSPPPVSAITRAIATSAAAPMSRVREE